MMRSGKFRCVEERRSGGVEEWRSGGVEFSPTMLDSRHLGVFGYITIILTFQRASHIPRHDGRSHRIRGRIERLHRKRSVACISPPWRTFAGALGGIPLHRRIIQ
jgi:hypothetical protein